MRNRNPVGYLRGPEHWVVTERGVYTIAPVDGVLSLLLIAPGGGEPVVVAKVCNAADGTISATPDGHVVLYTARERATGDLKTFDLFDRSVASRGVTP